MSTFEWVKIQMGEQSSKTLVGVEYFYHQVTCQSNMTNNHAWDAMMAAAPTKRSVSNLISICENASKAIILRQKFAEFLLENSMRNPPTCFQVGLRITEIQSSLLQYYWGCFRVKYVLIHSDAKCEDGIWSSRNRRLKHVLKTLLKAGVHGLDQV